MNYLSDVKPLEDVGKSAAEIAAILGTLRERPILLSDLEAKLTLWGILGRDPITNNRQGPLIDIATGNGPLKPVAVQLISWIGSSRSQQISTNTPDVSPIWAGGIAAMVAGGVLTQGQADVLNAFAGILRFPGVTEADVADSRAAWQAAEAARIAAEELANLRDGYRAQFDGVVNQIGTAEQPQAVAALRAIADALEA